MEDNQTQPEEQVAQPQQAAPTVPATAKTVEAPKIEEPVKVPEVMVNLIANGKSEPTAFEINHAQRILDLTTRPKVWKLKDDKYKLVNGKIVKI